MSSVGNRSNQHSFAQIPSVNIQRSSFNRSYSVKDTFDFDYLIPIFVDEVIPGDTFNVTVNAFARLATQKVPIMDNMYVDYFFFFVPNRLVFDKWEALCGAQENPTDTTDYSTPEMTPGAAFTVGSIFDHYGLPTDVANVAINNTMPLRAYIKIWNDWFRDENLQNSVTLPKDVGPDIQSDFALLKRGKRKDYFTGCLPWPQKGDAVSLPLTGDAPVKGIGKVNQSFVSAGANVYETGNVTTTAYGANDNSTIDQAAGANTQFRIREDVANPGFPAIYAEMSGITAATVNALRQAFMVQSILELDARGGTRYVEVLKAHYRVISPDFRLQRAEYLGGGSSKINSHPVAQTAPTSGSNPQAQLASFATHVVTKGDNIGFTKSFVEHGYVIGLCCARADLTYQQGVNRMWKKETRYDFFWPKLQELGEQVVQYGEIYAQGTNDDLGAFGYQERYAEYRYRPSEIRGQFRSTYATSLDIWHLAEEFGTKPELNAAFIVQNTPVDRCIAVPAEPHLLMDLWFSMTCARPMMTYSVPATIGRF